MLTDDFVATIRDAAEKLRGRQKRAFQAKVSVDYLGGSARRAETVFGWGREAVQKGLLERQGTAAISEISVDRSIKALGRPKTEDRLPQLEADIRSLVDPQISGRSTKSSRSQVSVRFCVHAHDRRECATSVDQTHGLQAPGPSRKTHATSHFGNALERNTARHGREDARVGQNDDLERDSTRGAALRPRLRNGNPVNSGSSQAVSAASAS